MECDKTLTRNLDIASLVLIWVLRCCSLGKDTTRQFLLLGDSVCSSKCNVSAVSESLRDCVITLRSSNYMQDRYLSSRPKLWR